MPRVLITGINGFIGSHLSRQSRPTDWQVIAPTSRRGDPQEGWIRELKDINAVVHLAGIAHRQATTNEYEAVNARWPAELFNAAREAGVSTFVHLSSARVLGDSSPHALSPTAPYRGTTAYALSKIRAEQALLSLEREAGAHSTRLFILRPPLVYGPGVKANFRALLRAAILGHQGLPLPLGNAQARRSYLSVSSLCNLIRHIIASGSATGGIFHVADERDWSVVDLLRLWGVPEKRLWRVPIGVVTGLAKITGRGRAAAALFTPCIIDQSQTLETLDWQPAGSSASHMEETLSWFRASR